MYERKFREAFSSRCSGCDLRPQVPEDSSFLFSLHQATLREASARMGFDMTAVLGEPMLRLQFAQREDAFRAGHPEASRLIITCSGEPIGRIYINWGGPEGFHGVDWALLPERRGGGTALHLMRAWLATADRFGVAVTLEVMPDNPAARLYMKLGFLIVGEPATPTRMRRPAAHNLGIKA